MGKGLKKTWLSAAECASRTGLTARALRVYEHRRLISPQRNDKGWRRYSTEDLVRLNTITTLKSLGLSLARIGAILQGDAPSLRQALQTSAQVWKAKKAEAERGAALVEAALRHLATHRRLAIDELCALIRSTTVTDQTPESRKILERYLSKDELRAWKAALSEQRDGNRRKSFVEDQGALLVEAQRLVDAAADPASVEAQKLVERWMKLLLQHSINSSVAAAQDRNGLLASKAISAARMAWNEKALPQQAAMEFLVTARRIRMEKGGLENLHTEVQQLIALKAEPSSAEAKRMVGRYLTFCSEQYQDDPAGWARVLARHVTDDGRRASWDYIAHAVQLQSQN